MTNNSNLKPFAKGYDSRRGTRLKGVPNMKTRIARLMNYVQSVDNPVTGEKQDMTIAEILDAQQVLKAMSGDTKAYNALLDRLEGKPAPTDVISDDINVKFEVINRVPIQHYEQ